MGRYIDADKLKYALSIFDRITVNVGGDKPIDVYPKWNVDNIIDDFSTADVKPVVRGEWIEDGYYDLPCVCSNCGHEESVKAKFLFSYCPHCGARMVKEVEEYC